MAGTDFPQRERITLLACFLAGGLGIGSWGANCRRWVGGQGWMKVRWGWFCYPSRPALSWR